MRKDNNHSAAIHSKTEKARQHRQNKKQSILMGMGILLGIYAIFQLIMLIGLLFFSATNITPETDVPDSLLGTIISSAMPHVLWYGLLLVVAVVLFRYAKRLPDSEADAFASDDASINTQSNSADYKEAFANNLPSFIASLCFIAVGCYLLYQAVIIGYQASLKSTDELQHGGLLGTIYNAIPWIEVIRPVFPWACFALFFLISGIFLFRQVYNGDYAREFQKKPVVPKWANTPQASQTNIELHPKNKSVNKFRKGVTAALLVCGTLGVMWQVTPFVMIAVFFIPALIWLFISLLKATVMLNPRFNFVLHDAKVQQGSTVTLSWILEGSTARLKAPSIHLIGEEQVIYMNGTDVREDNNLFHDTAQPIPDEEMTSKRGMLSFTIPKNSMHTLSAKNNKIVWMIRVTGRVTLGANLDEDYEITVYPHG